MSQTQAKRVVGIVDYKAGNIQSIENAFAQVGATVLRVQSGDELKRCSHVVLPGVGAFGFCAERLQASGMVDDLRRWAFDERRPLLGICVGMQLLADSSEESPNVAGLGWVGGTVRRLQVSAGIRVPHVGWNSVQFEHGYGPFAVGDAADFYFDHSFAYFDPRVGRTAGFCQHGERFSVIVESENITAFQFHPEKSQESGLKLLAGFLSR